MNAVAALAMAIWDVHGRPSQTIKERLETFSGVQKKLFL